MLIAVAITKHPFELVFFVEQIGTIFPQIVAFQTETIMPCKARNLVDHKLKNALAKCCGELKSLAPQLTSHQLE